MDRDSDYAHSEKKTPGYEEDGSSMSMNLIRDHNPSSPIPILNAVTIPTIVQSDRWAPQRKASTIGIETATKDTVEAVADSSSPTPPLPLPTSPSPSPSQVVDPDTPDTRLTPTPVVPVPVPALEAESSADQEKLKPGNTNNTNTLRKNTLRKKTGGVLWTLSLPMPSSVFAAAPALAFATLATPLG